MKILKGYRTADELNGSMNDLNCGYFFGVFSNYGSLHNL